MPDLVLSDMNETILHRLQERASRCGRTPTEEAKAILADVLQSNGLGTWTQVDAIYSRLAASGRTFSDSAGLLREKWFVPEVHSGSVRR